MTASLPFWIAIALAVSVPAILGQRRKLPRASLVLLAILPALMLQLAAVGAARGKWQADTAASRTEPQKLRYAQGQYAAGVYDRQRDSITFALPDRSVTIGPSKFAYPQQLFSVRMWAEGIGVGAVLVSLSFLLGSRIARGRQSSPLAGPDALPQPAWKRQSRP